MKTSRILLVLFFCFAFVGVVDDTLYSSISVFKLNRKNIWVLMFYIM